MKKQFDRRIYNIATFKTAIADAMAHIGEFKAARRSGRVSKAFSERIMLAVTQVNGCRYCHYGHAKAALAAGVSQEDIQYLVAGEFDELPKEEVIALLFAQHYAESEENPAPEAWQRVVDAYGPDAARDIMAAIRMITVGNLWGNTFDALLSRLASNPAPGSSLWQELGVLAGSFYIIPAALIKRRLYRHGKTVV
ncbi:MAG TPA: carboxymuconolactone decarboxylase family protein [Chloroflexi bacterium]|nr:carboxymuconolactone decarboxylase family protein [Chloroflexota bacterium]